MYLICYLTSYDHLIEGLCEFMGGNFLWYVTTPITIMEKIFVDLCTIFVQHKWNGTRSLSPKNEHASCLVRLKILRTKDISRKSLSLHYILCMIFQGKCFSCYSINWSNFIICLPNFIVCLSVCFPLFSWDIGQYVHCNCLLNRFWN